MTNRVVVMMTDFGLVDDFAGVCHGVILAKDPTIQVVQLTHGIDPQNVAQGAQVLRNTLRYMPVGVHLAVVDPGVGTKRHAIAVDCNDGRSFVGPDNGLLSLAIETAGGVKRAVAIENEAMMLTPVAATFHGRDIFAPAAAHLATGGDIGELGPDIPATDLVHLDLVRAIPTEDGLSGMVWHIDRFGNSALNIDEGGLLEFLGGAHRVELTIRNERVYASVGRTFDNVADGDLLLYIDAYGSVSIAMNKGDVTQIFRLRIGDQITLRAVHDDGESPLTRATTAMHPRTR